MGAGLTVVFSFIGTLIALLITKTVERGYTAFLARGEMSRDLIQHLADTLRAVERFIEPLTAPCDVRDAETLRKMPSSYKWSAPPLKLEKLLETFSEPETHRLLYQFFDRDSLFRAASEEHEAAYYWLLDEAQDWSAASARERIETILESRKRMLEYTREMLSLGYRLIEKLYEHADNLPANLIRGAARQFYEHLESGHGLTKGRLRELRAYYAGPREPPESLRAFDRAGAYGLLLLDDMTAAAVSEREGVAWVTVESADGASSFRLRMGASSEVALPAGVVLRNIAIRFTGDSAWRQAPLNQTVQRTSRGQSAALRVPDEVIALPSTDSSRLRS